MLGIAHLLALVPEVVQEVPMRHKLGDEAQRLLLGHTPNHVDNVGTEALRDLLHHVNLCPEVTLFLVAGCVWRKGRRRKGF